MADVSILKKNFPPSGHLRSPKPVLAAAVLVILAATAVLIFVLAPLPQNFWTRQGASSIRFTDRNGRLLREVRSFADGRSVPLPADRPVPAILEKAFRAAEDRRFRSHGGVDFLAVLRAAKSNLTSGRIVSGASTIHMQLARMVHPQKKSFIGKAREALWALRIGQHFDDDQVLREYLNRIPLGRDLIGVEAASEFYFNRPAAALSAAQAAMLAGIARSPAAADPFRHFDRAHRAMEQVLDAMEREGFIDSIDRKLASESPIDLVHPETAFLAPHLVTHLTRSLPSLGLKNAVLIETTIDMELQASLEKAMSDEILGLKERDVGNAAAIILDNASGDVLAYVGSINFFDEDNAGQNDGVRALRQPGSTLKPFAYGLALSEGMTPATILKDLETHLSTPAGSYVPKNYDRHVHGPVRLRAALANSYNVPAVQLMERLGPERVFQVLRHAGFDSLDLPASHYGVGLILGNGEVTLREMARAYRGLSRGGVTGPIREIRRAWDARGLELPVFAERSDTRFLSEDAVALLTDILADEAARASAFGHTNALRLPFPTAAKTGTSRAHVDNWVAGFTRERTVAVWVGNFNGHPMKDVSGITGAGPVFRRAMTLAMDGIAPQPLFDAAKYGLETAAVCPLSGELAGPYCGGQIKEHFLPGTSPKVTCRVHRPDGTLNLPPEYEEWAKSAGFSIDSFGAGNVAPGAGSGSSQSSHSGIQNPADAEMGQGNTRYGRFLMPADGDEFLLDPLLPLGAQTIRVRISPPSGVSSDALYLRISDGREIRLDETFGAHIELPRGRYSIELMRTESTAVLSRVHIRIR